MIRTLSRLAVSASLGAARLPLDAGLRLAGRTDSTAVDRLDASLRSLAGLVLLDSELQLDAERRRAAADERDRAAGLRAEAGRAEEEAADRRRQGERQAQARRRQAEESAQARSQRAREQREARQANAAETERKRKAASDRAAAAQEEAIAETAKRERLEQLDREAEALDEREEALTAADEAQRLKDAAGRAKATRKA